MKEALLRHLRDPISGEELKLETLETAGDEVISGLLRNAERWYPVIEGVPRLLLGELRDGYSQFVERFGLEVALGNGTADRSLGEHAGHRTEQRATNETFSDKWRRFRQYGFEPKHREFLHGWFAQKFGLESAEWLPAFYGAKKAILEVGPGSGFNTEFMAEHCGGFVVSVDVSAAALTTYENTRHLPNALVVQADLMDLPCPDEYFDFAIADGVLHHTPDTRRAMRSIYRKVKPGGHYFFYVYRQMGAARFFSDQHIRSAFADLEPELCYRACEGITELGRELSRLGARVELTKGIPELGIPPGSHDVQRLFYYNFLKCFWNDAFDWETNNMVNFDWYHPHNAWQHSEIEVRGWLEELGVEDFAFHPANPNGISCLLRKPA